MDEDLITFFIAVIGVCLLVWIGYAITLKVIHVIGTEIKEIIKVYKA